MKTQWNPSIASVIEDALGADAAGMAACVQETSETNQHTETTTGKEDRKRSKDIMGELKLDATKAAKQIIPGGPLTGSASDSLRKNYSNRAGNKPGKENIKGALKDKVSTISQADGNSERLIMNKPVSGLGSQNQDETHGSMTNMNRNNGTQVEGDNKEQMKTTKMSP